MPERITVAQLQYVVSAYEHGSLSAAAAAHYVAQPSVSEQIRRLESTLGVRLFVRTNRRLLLTEAGRTFLPYAERALRAVDDAMESVAPVRTLTGGSVAFGTFSSAHHLMHAQLAARFHAAHPDVRLRLVGMNSVQVAESVRSKNRAVAWVSGASLLKPRRRPGRAARKGAADPVWGPITTSRRPRAPAAWRPSRLRSPRSS